MNIVLKIVTLMVWMIGVLACGSAQPRSEPMASVANVPEESTQTSEPIDQPESSPPVPWSRQSLTNFTFVSADFPGEVDPTFSSILNRYRLLGAFHGARHDGAEYIVFANRTHFTSGVVSDRATQWRSEGCTVEHTLDGANFQGSTRQPFSSESWQVRCQAFVAEIRIHSFRSGECGPGHGVTMIVVHPAAVPREAADRFFGSLRLSGDQGC